MNKLYKVELEVGTKYHQHQGITKTSPEAFISIETDDETLRDALIFAIARVESERWS